MTSRRNQSSLDVARIESARNRWIAAINQGDPDAFVEVVAPDALWAAPGAGTLSGRARIKDWLRDPFRRFRYRYAVNNVRIFIDGGWALERSDFESVIAGHGGRPARTHRGTYTVIWRRGSDGWLIERYLDEALLGGD